MSCKPIYEFIVWDNCCSSCDFCFQHKKFISTFGKSFLKTIQEKTNHLKSVLNFLNSSEYISGSHVLAVGGEIFDCSDMRIEIETFYRNLIQMMNSGKIDLLYINTNLLYRDTLALNNVLSMFSASGLFSRIKFTTSYDIAGRFHTDQAKALMTDNLVSLYEHWPDLKKVTNIILSKQACCQISSHEFSVKAFSEKFHTDINLIPYIGSDSFFKARKSDIFKAIKISGDENPEWLEKYVFNFLLKQEKKVYFFKDEKIKNCSSKLSNSCGHSINFKNYSENGSSCFICDLKELFHE